MPHGDTKENELYPHIPCSNYKNRPPDSQPIIKYETYVLRFKR